jgi:hypothetical protein
MQIVFAGICCWVDASPPKLGKTVIIRNALGGGMHNGMPIPSHTAFIHAKRDQVDASNWGSNWSGSDDNLLFWLTGDYLTFDPVPSGGAIDISLLPHVRDSNNTDAICPGADEIRPGFLENPTPSAVLALVDVPPDADVHCTPNANHAMYATLTIPATPVTVTATPFEDGDSSPRSLTINDPDARVFIANVTVSEYLAGVGAPDDDHKYLVCEIFSPHAVVTGKPGETKLSERRKASLPVLASRKSVTEAHAAELDRITLTKLRRAANRSMHEFLDTLAGGCSDSRWP